MDKVRGQARTDRLYAEIDHLLDIIGKLFDKLNSLYQSVEKSRGLDEDLRKSVTEYILDRTLEGKIISREDAEKRLDTEMDPEKGQWSLAETVKWLKNYKTEMIKTLSMAKLKLTQSRGEMVKRRRKKKAKRYKLDNAALLEFGTEKKRKLSQKTLTPIATRSSSSFEPSAEREEYVAGLLVRGGFVVVKLAFKGGVIGLKIGAKVAKALGKAGIRALKASVKNMRKAEAMRAAKALNKKLKTQNIDDSFMGELKRAIEENKGKRSRKTDEGGSRKSGWWNQQPRNSEGEWS